MTLNKIDGELLQKIIISSANNLANNKKMVDELNVFPVPDGDTGTNMSLTFLNAAKEISEINENSVEKVANMLSYACLRGARGNSGVILSQIIRGFCKIIANHENIDSKTFARALKEGSDTAYKAVMRPTEGTILTVIKESAKMALQISETSDDIVFLIEETVKHANHVLQMTPDMLPVLKKAGVVDAGGKGLLFLLEGALEVVKYNKEVKINKHGDVDVLSDDDGQYDVDKIKKDLIKANIVADDIKYIYCTELRIEMNTSEHSAAKLSEMYKDSIAGNGDSIMVIDGDTFIKVHIHTNNPGDVIERALKIGEITDVKIDNMKKQNLQVSKVGNVYDVSDANEKEFGFIAVAVGEGIISVFKDIGVDYIVEGGQTMNPSTDDILRAVNSLNAKIIFIFPNNKNIILAAEQAKSLTNKSIYVINSKNIPQGISAMLAFNENKNIEENYTDMENATKSILTGSITYAVRNSSFEDKEISEGDFLGMIDGNIYASGRVLEEICRQVVDALVDDEKEILTIFSGKDVEDQTVDGLIEYIEEKYPDLDVEVHNGGQPVYYFIISTE